MAIEGSKAAIYEWNKKTGYIYLAPHYKNLLGYESGDLQDFTVEKFFTMIHEDDLPLVQESFDRHLLTHRPYKTEMRIRTRAGSYKWVSDTGTSKFNEKGEQILIVGSIIDIDERKMAEQQIRLQNDLLAKANDELDRFVYSASHDLRAPLSSLLGVISVAEKTEDSKEIALCLEMMKKRVLTMENFIKEITDYSRNSRLGVEHKPVRVHKLVHDIVDSLKFTHGAERIAIEIDISHDLTFMTDDNRLKVIVNNLVANAIRYHALLKPTPFIQIKACQKDDGYLLSVEDNGQGISDEHKDKIFNMFYRASENSEGSGLGLYIVKETLTKLHGKVMVDSTIYEGSTFSIFLPVNFPDDKLTDG
jgi:PAS domain S-box-containing protein